MQKTVVYKKTVRIVVGWPECILTQKNGKCVLDLIVDDEKPMRHPV